MRYYDIKYKVPYDSTNPSGDGFMMVLKMCPDNQAAYRIKELEENWAAVILEIVKSNYD